MTVFTIFLASLLGSAHCAGMCGGFVSLVSCESKHRVVSQTMYSLGRLTTYLALGGIAGIVGTTFDRLGVMTGIASVSSVIVGVALVLWGSAGIFGIAWPTRLRSSVTRFATPHLSRLLGPLLKNSVELAPGVRSYCIGASTTLLPCGWLYAFVAVAAASGSVIRSLIIMTVFWIGTLPMMLTLGGIGQRVIPPLLKKFPRLTSALVLCAGLLSIGAHLGFNGLHDSAACQSGAHLSDSNH